MINELLRKQSDGTYKGPGHCMSWTGGRRVQLGNLPLAVVIYIHFALFSFLLRKMDTKGREEDASSKFSHTQNR